LKIYTGTGDRGKTSLFSGERVRKDHARIEACGEVDELASALGWLGALLPADAAGIRREIRESQAVLFRLGAWISACSPEAGQPPVAPLSPEACRFLEAAIDRMSDALPPLHHFILPGGSPAAASAHLARTICRRAERRIVFLLLDDQPAEACGEVLGAVSFLSRLSDYLCLLARFLNHQEGVSEVLWNA